jgi:hypothetical protein
VITTEQIDELIERVERTLDALDAQLRREGLRATR